MFLLVWAFWGRMMYLGQPQIVPRVMHPYLPNRRPRRRRRGRRTLPSRTPLGAPLTPAPHLGFSFDPGKMFERMFTFTSDSFSLQNITSSIGSGIAGVFTLGLAPTLMPETFSAHSELMENLGAAFAPIGPMIQPGEFSGTSRIIAGVSMAIVSSAVAPIIVDKLTVAADGLGITVGEGAFGSKLLGFLQKLPTAGQELIAKVMSPSEIQEFEETGAVPPSWREAVGAPPPPTGTRYVAPGTPGSVNLGSLMTPEQESWLWIGGLAAVGVVAYAVFGR